MGVGEGGRMSCIVRGGRWGVGEGGRMSCIVRGGCGGWEREVG